MHDVLPIRTFCTGSFHGILDPRVGFGYLGVSRFGGQSSRNRNHECSYKGFFGVGELIGPAEALPQ